MKSPRKRGLNIEKLKESLSPIKSHKVDLSILGPGRAHKKQYVGNRAQEQFIHAQKNKELEQIKEKRRQNIPGGPNRINLNQQVNANLNLANNGEQSGRSS